MKKIVFSSIILSIIAIGCRDGINRNRPAITRNPTTPLSSIRLRATNKGNVKSINFAVQLHGGANESLLDYRGPVTLTGSIHTDSAIPCLNSAHSFRCPAELSGVGNIRVNQCRIASSTFNMLIVLKRGEHLRQAATIDSIQIYPDHQCWFYRRNRGRLPHRGGYPHRGGHPHNLYPYNYR